MLSHQVIPLIPEYIVDYDDSAGIDCDQVAKDVAVFPIPFKCEVMLAGVAVTETCAGGTTTPVVDFDKRPTAGSDANRGAADIGHLVLSTTAAGKMMYDLVAAGIILYPGEEVVCQLATAATGASAAGHIRPILLVKFVPEEAANISDMVETA